MRNNDFLIEVAKNRYHIFPGIPGTTQEESMFLVGDKQAGLSTFKLAQKDGSRFSIIETSRKPTEIVIRIGAAHPNRRPIWIGKRLPRAELIEALISEKLSPKNTTYLAYRTHCFLNGSRYYPILVQEQLNTFIDISNLFLEQVPEDEMGVFAEKDAGLGIKKSDGYSWIPLVIDYFSEIRMCKQCGVVSNFSKPKQNPWGATLVLNLEIQQRLLKGEVVRGSKAGRPKKKRTPEQLAEEALKARNKKLGVERRGRPKKINTGNVSSGDIFGFEHDRELKLLRGEE